MNIAKALKEKNRIAGRIVQLQRRVQQYNRWTEDNEPEFNALELKTELEKESALLTNLKIKIALANAGVADKLVCLAEAKSQLAYWSSFVGNTGAKEESYTELGWVDGERQQVTKKRFAAIPTTDAIAEQKRLQDLVEKLQDEIDEYNATTQI